MNKRLMAIVSAGALTVGAMVTAFAATSNTDASATTAVVADAAQTPDSLQAPPSPVDTSNWTDEQKALLDTAMKQDNDETTRKAALASLVSAGLITQDQSDRMAEGKGGGGGKMFDTSSWTDEQKTLLETAMKRDNDETTRKAALASLVSAGLITQDQSDRMAEGKGGGRGMVDTSSWTDEQKALLDTAMKQDSDETARKAALASLVSAGLITQDQSDRMAEGKGGGRGMVDTSSWTDEQKALLDTAMKQDSDETARKAALASLVSAGLITQDKSDRMAEGKGGGREMVDTSSWTDEQKTLLETAMKRDNDETTRKAALASLVSAGLITQDQSDRMAEGKGGGGGKMFDTSSWTDEQKTLLETAMKQDNDETTRKAALASLVSAGLITQDQSDRVSNRPERPDAPQNAATTSSSITASSTSASSILSETAGTEVQTESTLA